MIHSRLNNSILRRQGATTIEFVTAGAVLATVLCTLVPFVSHVWLVNEDIADREFAARQVRNAIVELQNLSPEVQLSPQAQERLTEAEFVVERDSLKETQLQQVTVSLSWVNHFGKRGTPVTLSFWEPQPEAP